MHAIINEVKGPFGSNPLARIVKGKGGEGALQAWVRYNDSEIIGLRVDGVWLQAEMLHPKQAPVVGTVLYSMIGGGNNTGCPLRVIEVNKASGGYTVIGHFLGTGQTVTSYAKYLAAEIPVRSHALAVFAVAQEGPPVGEKVYCFASSEELVDPNERRSYITGICEACSDGAVVVSFDPTAGGDDRQVHVYPRENLTSWVNWSINLPLMEPEVHEWTGVSAATPRSDGS